MLSVPVNTFNKTHAAYQLFSFSEVGAGGEEVQVHSESFDLSKIWTNSPNVWAKKLPCFSTINP